ncbi:MBL-fold metallo-hydrolase superfamily, partial [hydrothermal vent metagenome]
MKNMILLFCLLMNSLSALANSAFFDKFKAEKINATVYVVHGPLEMPNSVNLGFMNNPAFVVAEKSVVVIDPGSSQQSGEMLLREIKKITNNPVSHIFNTHIHGDHWLANDIIKQKYPNVKIFADPRMIKKAKSGDAQTWIDRMLSLTKNATKGTQIAYPGVAISDGKQLNIAGLNFKIHSVGVGHSDSDIMIEYVNDSTFFTGDNAGHLRILRMSDGSFRDVIKSLDRAIDAKAKYYVPGHGPTGSVSIIELQREYLSTLYSQVEKYYEDGLEDFEMKPKIELALSKFKDWVGFEKELGKHISLAKLEIE